MVVPVPKMEVLKDKKVRARLGLERQFLYDQLFGRLPVGSIPEREGQYPVGLCERKR
jgi:hypothetical protein